MSSEHKDDEARPIIIRRVKKIKKGGHHGGSWKIAYADFVTAMMAFFLLMWLLGLLNKYQLAGVSDYFAKPLKEAAQHDPHIKGMGNDKNIKADKEKEKQKQKEKEKEKEKGKGSETKSEAKEESASSHAQQQNQQQNQQQQSSLMMVNPTQGQQQKLGNSEKPMYVLVNPYQQQKPRLGNLQQAAQDVKVEKVTAESMKSDLQHKLETDPQLREYKNQLNFQITADGLKIQLRDLENKSMFTKGKADFDQYAGKIVAWLSKELNNYQNRVMIIGHTDAAPYDNNDYTNWELSADRANATRRALVKNGMNLDKIVRVVGVADTDLLDKSNGINPINRHIDIIVLTGESMKKISR